MPHWNDFESKSFRLFQRCTWLGQNTRFLNQCHIIYDIFKTHISPSPLVNLMLWYALRISSSSDYCYPKTETSPSLICLCETYPLPSVVYVLLVCKLTTRTKYWSITSQNMPQSITFFFTNTWYYIDIFGIKLCVPDWMWIVFFLLSQNTFTCQ